MSGRGFLLFMLACLALVGGIVYRDVRNDTVCIERSGMPCAVLIEKMRGWDQ